MRIAVLGPLEVSTDDGRTVTVPGAKERLLLAVLAAGSPDVVSTDRIVETLWNGEWPASARKSLQVHLVHLRSALEPDRPRGATDGYVVRRGNGYALTTAPDDVDALRVGDLVGRGRARLASGEPAEAVLLLSAALGLWRGEPYGDWPDASFADAERRRLTEVRAGARTTLLEARLALGEDAEVVAEAERLLADDPLKEEWWRLLVLALYRSGRQGDALAAVARARAVLVEQLGAEPGPRLRAAEEAVLAQDPALDLPRPRPPPDVAICPYKGLAAYQTADAGLFHGRDRVVARLVGRLVDAPLLVVSGASGAGKSSLVRAGLIPTLAAGALPGSEAWRTVVVTPGRRPIDALTTLTGNTSPTAPVLLICDQFEELWAPGVDATQRTVFLDTLLELLDDGRVVRCVAVVRGDHVGRLAEHAGFTERLGAALVLVPPLTGDELREVVRGPAATVGLAADTELLDAVVADVAGRPAALPLLSTALVGTWERRRGDRLTLAGYLEAGRVSGALARAAEAAFTGLDEEGRTAARRLFVRLADADEGGGLVRRPLPLTELDLENAARRAVVEAFVSRRLLAVDGEVLDVVHEALLTAWPRLARWLEDDSSGRAVRRHLVPAAREWERRGEPDDELYRGARLAAALDWAADAEQDLVPVEQRFLAASKDRSDAELTDARDRLRREVGARRRTRRMALGLAAVLVVALVATVLAVGAQRAAERSSETAERESLVADANRLAALSRTAVGLDLSYLLAAQAFRLEETPETWDALLAALVEHRRADLVARFTGDVRGAELTDAGRTLVIGAGLQLVSWDIGSAEPPGTRLVFPSEEPWEGFLSSNASPTEDRTVHVGAGPDGPWVRTVDGEGDFELLPSSALLDGVPFGVAFTPDGNLLDVFVEASGDGGVAASPWRLVQIDPSGGPPRDTGIADTLPLTEPDLTADISEDVSVAVVWSRGDPTQATLVDLATGRQVRATPPPRDALLNAYVALSSGAAALWDDGAVTVFDRTGHVVQELGGHRAPVRDVALAPDGSWAVTVAERGEVLLWDVDPATGHWSMRESLTGHTGDVFEVEIDPEGSHVVTVSRDNRVIVWDIGPDGGFGTSHPGLPGRWMANRPEDVEPGRLVVAATRSLDPRGQAIPYLGEGTLDAAATFLDPRTGEVVDQVDVGNTVEDAVFGASVAVSPDGGLVAVTSGLAVTVLDTRTRDVVKRLDLPDGFYCSAEWTPDGSRLLLGHEGRGCWAQDTSTGVGDILVVDVATWEVVDRHALDVQPEFMELGPDDRSLAISSGSSPEVVILDVNTLEERHRVSLDVDERFWDLAFSPDGRLLAGGGQSGRLHVVDLDTWEAREAVSLHDGPLLQLEWLDDRTVVSTGLDGTVRLFDVERAIERVSPLPASVDDVPGYGHWITAPDSELVVFNDDRVALRYPMDPAVWIRQACAVVGRDLTRAEWDQYLPGRAWQATCTDLG